MTGIWQDMEAKQPKHDHHTHTVMFPSQHYLILLDRTPQETSKMQGLGSLLGRDVSGKGVLSVSDHWSREMGSRKMGLEQESNRQASKQDLEYRNWDNSNRADGKSYVLGGNRWDDVSGSMKLKAVKVNVWQPGSSSNLFIHACSRLTWYLRPKMSWYFVTL